MLHLTLTNSIVQGQGHEHLGYEYLGNGDRGAETVLLPSNRNYYTLVRLDYLYFNLAHSKGQGQGRAHFDREYILQSNDTVNLNASGRFASTPEPHLVLLLSITAIYRCDVFQNRFEGLLFV